MADKVAEEVAAKRADHLENTPKRQREAMSRRIDADHLERTEQALRALAGLLQAGEVPLLLAKFTSKKAIYEALRTRTESGGMYHIADTGEASDESPEAAALWQLVAGKDPEQEKADRLRELVADVQGRKIPGYFRTPPDLVAEMLDRAEIRAGHVVLEPSAGDGAILEQVEDLHADPLTVCFEINPTLCEVLRARGFDARPVDFLEQEPGQVRYDRVLMNPPFEKLQDVEHVQHAFRFLKPGGRLVAIMSPGPFFHDTKKASDFRDWFEDLGGEVEEIEAGAFKESGTGVASRLVVLDKPEEPEEPEEIQEPERFRPEAPSFEISEQPSLF
jgi:predicted RNA methylase